MITRIQAVDALAQVLRNLPDPAQMVDAGLTPVIYRDHIRDVLFFTVDGVEFEATVVTVA